MTIPANSTSYPFLAIAQAHGVPYGQVLAIVDFHRRKRVFRRPDFWEDQAMRQVSERVYTAIQTAWAAELKRHPRQP